MKNEKVILTEYFRGKFNIVGLGTLMVKIPIDVQVEYDDTSIIGAELKNEDNNYIEEMFVSTPNCINCPSYCIKTKVLYMGINERILSINFCEKKYNENHKPRILYRGKIRVYRDSETNIPCVEIQSFIRK